MSDMPFGLCRRAFPATPDHSCYYPATTHEQALDRLLRGLEDGEGLLLLAANPGLGKTLLCHVLLDRIGSNVQSAFLTNTNFRDRLGLLQAIAYELSLPFEGRGEQELRLAVTDQLLKSFVSGTRTIIVIDEAHHLRPELLEELRMLGNLEASAGKAVQVVLVGQADLLKTINLPALSSLRQRIAIKATLEPLEVQEAADYLLHHLRAAGGKPEEILDDEAIELLAQQTQGVPRLMNQAAHQALLLCSMARQDGGAERVDAEVVFEVLGQLGLPGEMLSADEPLLVDLPEDQRQVLPMSDDDEEESIASGRTA